MQQRKGDEDQTPMFSKGVGTPHPVLVEAQLPFAVLIKRFRRPPVQQYFSQKSGSQAGNGAIVTKLFISGAGFFQAVPLG